MFIPILQERSANLFTQIPDIKNRRQNLFELDKRAKTAMNKVGTINNDIQKFDYRPQYTDLHSQLIFTQVKEHLILKNLDNDNQKRKFLMTKKLFDVFYPLDEEDYKLEDIVKQSGIKTNPDIFKKRKSMLVVHGLKNKDKSKGKEALADILKNINELKDSFLRKPPPVKIIKNKKSNIDINKDFLNTLKNKSVGQFSHLVDPDKKKEIDINAITRLSSPKKLNKKVTIKIEENLILSPSSPKKTTIGGPNDNINKIFQKMMSGSVSNSLNSPLRKHSKAETQRITSGTSDKRDKFKITLETVDKMPENTSLSPKNFSKEKGTKEDKDNFLNEEDNIGRKLKLSEENKIGSKKPIINTLKYAIISENSSRLTSTSKDINIIHSKESFSSKKSSFLTESKSPYKKKTNNSIQKDEDKPKRIFDIISNKHICKKDPKRKEENSSKGNIEINNIQMNSYRIDKDPFEDNSKKNKRQSYLNILNL